jgi:nickel transport protein
MKLVITFLFLSVLPIAVNSASAHRVNVFAWVDGDMIYVESKFSGGKKVKAGKVVVMDPQGVELHSGITNDRGEYAFKIPKQTDLRIILIAGQGHQGEWTVHAAELKGSALEAPARAGTRKAGSSEQTTAATDDVIDPGAAAPVAGNKAQELEAVIEAVLDRKLKPIASMLADMRQKGPGIGDIFSGIGYILGLAGIAAYVHNRRKKD